MADEYLTDEDKAFLGINTPAPRSPWQRFKSSYIEGALHSPLGAEAVVRRGMKLSGKTDEEINAAERRLSDKLAAERAADEEAFKDVDTLSPANIGKHAVDLLGNIFGGVDPTYVLAPGKSVATRIASQGGINAGVNAGSQAVEIGRGVRDKFSKEEVLLNAAAGVGVQGGQEIARAIARGGKVDLNTAKDIGNKFGTVTSTIRTPERNKKVGGAANSHHLYGRAIDIARGKGVTHKQIERAYRRAGYDIIESLDEGDHSHFAFRFGKRKGEPVLEDFDFRPPEQRSDVADLDEARAKKTLDDWTRDIDFNEGPRTAEEWDAIRQADDASAPFAPPLDSSHEKFTPYVERPNDPANDPDSRFDNPFPDFTEIDDANYAKTFLNENTDFTPGELMKMSNSEALKFAKANGFNKEWEGFYDAARRNAYRPGSVEMPPRPNLYLMDDVLTPAERQEMDASAVRPDVDPTVPAGLGKGSVATTPVNDLRQPDVAPPPRPPFPDEPDFPKPGTPGNRGGPYGGDDAPLHIRAPAAARPEMPRAEPETVKQRLMDDLKRLKPMTGDQRRLYREERSKRGSSLSNLQRGEATRENISQQFGSQRGQLPRRAFQSIAENYSEADFVALANQINHSPRLLPFQKLNAHKALINLLGAEGAKLPTPSEIKLLGEVYGDDFVKALLENRPLLTKIWDHTKSALNVPRAIMSSMDFSAPFRQGIGLVHKKEFWKAIPHMFKMWADTIKGGSKDKDWLNSLKAHPRWGDAVEAKLAITDPHSHFLADREEDFMTDWAERIPFGVGRLIKGSNSAYSGFLNKLRWDTFNNLLDQYEAMGEVVDAKRLKQVGKFVNMATGRGDLGKTMNAAAPAFSALLFSPRLIASRVKTLVSPVTYMAADPLVRKEAWKSLFAMSGYYMTLGGIAKYLLGMEVETDPRSSDFMKAKIGNTRYDFLAGYSQYIRLGAQILTDSTITGKGVEKDLTSSTGYKDDTRRDVFIRFFLNKLAPVPSLVSDWMEGSDMTGADFEWKKAIANRMLPMASQDIADAIREWGPIGAAMGLPGLAGWSVQTYEPRQKKEKPVSDEEFLNGTVDASSESSELSAEDKEFLGL